MPPNMPTVRTKLTSAANVKTGILNRLRSSSGWSSVNSTQTQAASATPPIAKRVSTAVLVQPSVAASDSPSSMALKPIADRTKPRRSNLRPGTWADSRRRVKPRNRPSSPMGTFRVKMTRQSMYSTM